MKMPLLAVVSTQNSALISRAPYDCLVTRYPPIPLSAWTAPSTIVQLASPTLVNASRFLPPNSVVKPPPPRCADSVIDVAATSINTTKRFISTLHGPTCRSAPPSFQADLKVRLYVFQADLRVRLYVFQAGHTG